MWPAYFNKNQLLVQKNVEVELWSHPLGTATITECNHNYVRKLCFKYLTQNVLPTVTEVVSFLIRKF